MNTRHNDLQIRAVTINNSFTAVMRCRRCSGHHRTFLQEEARGLHSAGPDQISCDAGLNCRIKHSRYLRCNLNTSERSNIIPFPMSFQNSISVLYSLLSLTHCTHQCSCVMCFIAQHVYNGPQTEQTGCR